MRAFQIAEDSEFYKYIKMRIDFASKIDMEDIRHRKLQGPSFIPSNIYYHIKEIQEKNKELIDGRYRHYELYRGMSADAPSITDVKDKNGRTFFYKVYDLDMSTSTKLVSLLKGVYQKTMSPEQLEQLAIDIENDLLRVKKVDDTLTEASNNIIAYGNTNHIGHFLGKIRNSIDGSKDKKVKAKRRVFSGNEKVKKLVENARKNPGKIAKAVGAIIIGATIVGVSCVSCDDIKDAVDRIRPDASEYENESSMNKEEINFSISEEDAIGNDNIKSSKNSQDEIDF